MFITVTMTAKVVVLENNQIFLFEVIKTQPFLLEKNGGMLGKNQNRETFLPELMSVGHGEYFIAKGKECILRCIVSASSAVYGVVDWVSITRKHASSTVLVLLGFLMLRDLPDFYSSDLDEF